MPKRPVLFKGVSVAENVDLSILAQILKKYESQSGNLIAILQEAQEAYGYLPGEVLTHIRRETKIPLSRIYGVVTFYAQFYLTPRGRNTVRVCRGTACHVRRGGSVLKAAEGSLGIKEGETTGDLKFSLETVACLGTCFLAPVMMVNRSYFGRLVPQRVGPILEQFA